MPPKYTHFTDLEAAGIEPDLMAMLDVAREKAGVPFTITCGLRSPEHNAEVGGVSDSAHLPDANGLSQAVDLACVDSSDRWKMVFALKDAGLKRIVIEGKHVHCDVSEYLPQYVLAVLDKP
jgi:uncharacterized protein YcbK (DUF882 family)